MKILLSAIILLLSFKVQSQILGCKDLISLSSCQNNLSFKKSVLNMGFIYVDKDTFESRVYYNYYSKMEFICSSNSDVKFADMTSVSFKRDGNTLISYSTGVLSHYEIIFNGLSKYGFYFTKADGNDQYYTSPSYPKMVIMISTDDKTTDAGDHWKMYTYTIAIVK